MIIYLQVVATNSANTQNAQNNNNWRKQHYSKLEHSERKPSSSGHKTPKLSINLNNNVDEEYEDEYTNNLDEVTNFYFSINKQKNFFLQMRRSEDEDDHSLMRVPDNAGGVGYGPDIKLNRWLDGKQLKLGDCVLYQGESCSQYLRGQYIKITTENREDFYDKGMK